MKDILQFIKISAWLAVVAFVLGGLWMGAAWWTVPGDVVFVRVILLCVSVFGISLCGMVILDVILEAKEERGKIHYRKYDSIPNRNARCKGYVDLTPGGNYNGVGSRNL